MCENTKTQSYTESFRGSISTDHAKCEGVILHTWCGQLLDTQRGRSVCRSVTIRKNLKTASFRLSAISSVSLVRPQNRLGDLDLHQNLGFGFGSVFTENRVFSFSFKTDPDLIYYVASIRI